MKLTFLGTKANIDATSRRHRRHSSLLIQFKSSTIRLDCGADWLGRADEHEPDAIVLTHGHPDHAFGLRDGAPCPVYATEDTWTIIDAFPIDDRRTLPATRPVRIGPFTVRAFPVEHSVRAPAVALRVAAGNATILYAPDLIAINERRRAMHGIDVYIGDGSSITRPLVRPAGDALVGHAAIRTQLGWCQREHIRRAIFTHCGTPIVTGDERRLGPQVRRLGRDRDVDASIAHDGLELTLH